jgi:hypothetical protein
MASHQVVNSQFPTYAFIVLHIKGHDIISNGGGKAKDSAP